MTRVPGKWVCLLSETLSYIASYPFAPLWDDCIHMCWDGLGWAGQQWLSYSSIGSELYTVRLCLLSALSWLAFCLSLYFFSDVSVHQWLMSPLRTWLIFHLQPASQLLSELSISPRAWTQSSAHHNICFSETVWFSESPKTDASHASVSTWLTSHLIFLSTMSFFFCVFASSL